MVRFGVETVANPKHTVLDWAPYGEREGFDLAFVRPD